MKNTWLTRKESLAAFSIKLGNGAYHKATSPVEYACEKGVIFVAIQNMLYMGRAWALTSFKNLGASCDE